MTTTPDPLDEVLTEARTALADVRADRPAEALPLLRQTAELVSRAIDETLARTVLSDVSIRAAAQLAGLSENAVGPRLARTAALAAYGDVTGKVTAKGVERARYDVERGEYAPVTPPAPMRFRARRND
jgi:hypothetical protein